jgi:cellulose synthase/poly-beta-1,6-N-acetylglucosamine synthase-like glycosyltransferase
VSDEASDEYIASVIVPAYNEEDTLPRCLAALEAQSVPRDRYEILVVDDGSSDRTAQIAQQHGVRLIRQPNAGPAAARNRGVQEARGNLVLFTDADCEPAPDWIEQMIAPFGEGPRDAPLAGAKGAYRTRQREAVARFVQLEYEDRYARMRRQPDIDFIDTYSAAYRRDVFVANGGFDTRFTTSSVEDQEFSFRLARQGYRLQFIPQALVYHQHDATWGEYWKRKFGIGYWKALLLRWHPDKAVHDSHTPQVLKVQIGLLGLLIASLPLLPFWEPARWFALALAILFTTTALPFLAWIARRDPAILPTALPLIVLRALALGSGLAGGFVQFSRQPNPRPLAGGD